MSTARASFLSAPRCISQTISTVDLTAAVNGAAQTISLTEKIPANAIVLQTWMNLSEVFAGGGATAVVLDVGWSGGAFADSEAYYKNQDVWTGAATGIRAVGAATLGNRIGFSNCDVDAAERTVTAVFTPDAGHKLGLLTTGSVSLNIIYVIQAANDLILPQ